MRHQRNTDGIRLAAQRKREAALERTDAAIRQLVKAGKPVNFTTVSEAAKVSKAWLYEETEIKARITQLRGQSTPEVKSGKPKHHLSDGSKDAIILTLKGRIKALEQRNRELSQQNEVFGGQVLRVRELEQQLKRIEADNTLIRQQVRDAKPSANCAIETELEQMGVQLNSTIQRLLRDAPPAVIQTALRSLSEAVVSKRVENPSGFFHQAVTFAWSPNEPIEAIEQRNLFNDWFPLAQKARLVVAATEIEGVQHVLTIEDKWVAFSEMLAQFPLDAFSSAI